MENQKNVLELIDKLKDLDYFIFGGFAIHLYSDQKRGFDDIDVLMDYSSLVEFSNRLNADIQQRKITKGGLEIQDHYFETNYKGQDIEAIAFVEEVQNQKKAFKRQFKNKVVKKIDGQKVFIKPIEGVLVHKAILKRPKDIKDLEMLKEKKDIDWELVEKIAKLKGKYKQACYQLEKVGYDLGDSM